MSARCAAIGFVVYSCRRDFELIGWWNSVGLSRNEANCCDYARLVRFEEVNNVLQYRLFWSIA